MGRRLVAVARHAFVLSAVSGAVALAAALRGPGEPILAALMFAFGAVGVMACALAALAPAD